MFDASFLELLIVSVVALLVLGPEKLPGAIKTVGLWIGRLRRSFNNIKRDIEKEIGADEIRRQLRNEAIMEKFDSTKSQFTKTVDSIKKETNTIKEDMDFSKEVTGFMGEDKSSDANKIDATDSSKDTVDSLVNTPANDTSSPTPDMFNEESNPEPESTADKPAPKPANPDNKKQ